MDVTRKRLGIIPALIAGACFGCETRPNGAPVSDPRVTLQGIGRRLSRSYSEHDLSVISSRAELILALLDRHERSALRTGISVSTPNRRSRWMWPSRSNRSRSGSLIRASRQRTSRSLTVIRHGAFTAETLNQAGSGWASTVWTVHRSRTTSFLSGRAALARPMANDPWSSSTPSGFSPGRWCQRAGHECGPRCL